MPQSLILNLISQDAIAPQHLQGYALQQLFFDLVEAVDLDLGRVLRRDKRNCAYRLSALQVNAPQINTALIGAPQTRSFQVLSASKLSKAKLTQNSLPKSSTGAIHSEPSPQKSTLRYACNTPLNPQTESWWRVAFLDDALLDHLVTLWNQIGHETFQLGPANVRITQATVDATVGDWADSCSYQDIYENASSYERDVRLQIITPVVFDHGNDITPLPTIEAVFQPLRKCWNHYSTLAFAPSLLSSIIPNSFDIQTVPIHDIQSSSYKSITGCIGHISFCIDSEDSLTIKRINTLANYTQYCGIGYNARLGLGVIKRLRTSAIAVGQSTLN